MNVHFAQLTVNAPSFAKPEALVSSYQVGEGGVAELRVDGELLIVSGARAEVVVVPLAHVKFCKAPVKLTETENAALKRLMDNGPPQAQQKAKRK